MGRPGSEYRVEVRNREGGDLLAVVSVDGVNVITGESAHPAQSGYVVGPRGRLAVDGWRKSLGLAEVSSAGGSGGSGSNPSSIPTLAPLGSNPQPQAASTPRPNTGGAPATNTQTEDDDGGSSSTMLPIVAGIVGVLVVLGGGGYFLIQRKKAKPAA